MATTRRVFLKGAAGAACQALLLPASGAFAASGFDSRDRNVKEAYFYESLDQGVVQCETCPHACIILPDNRGKCGTKVNLSGRLYSISYGNPCTMHADPVEKKPLYHFHPGAKAFSMAVAGCNFTCLNCQNWEISQTTPDKTRNYDMPPEKVVARAKKYGCKSIAYTYSESTTFYEYMVDTSAIAKEQGIKNIWVSNAYMSPKAVKRLCTVIDAASLNLKSLSDDIYMKLNGGHLAPVQETLKIVRDNGVWLEIIHLVVPTYTDNLDEIKRVAGWIAENIGPDCPLHLSRFFPKYRLVHLAATSVSFLMSAQKAAQAEGLHHVYVGNVAGQDNHVLCPSCKKPVVKRNGYYLDYNGIQKGACPFCQEPVAGRWSG